MTDWQPRAEAVLAGGPGTFSKHWSRYPQGLAPFGLVSGEGAFVTGTDGRTYLDTVGALGPNLLGYGHSAVVAAVQTEAAHGGSFSMVTPLEITTAELLCNLLPCAEMVRWCRNGTDATGMAVRLARAITGHRHGIFVGYHGGAMDSYGITTDKRAGLLPVLAPYNHQLAWDSAVAQVEAFPAERDLACIMVEVPALPWGTLPTVLRQTLSHLQHLAGERGALFILDEIVTFPRYGIHGAQGLYHLTPDLCTVSKGIANGLPLAALVGPRRHMSRLNAGDIFGSWTFAGETTALAACTATLKTCRDTPALQVLRQHGQRLGDVLQQVCWDYRLPASVLGNYARIALRWRDLPGVATAAELRTLWLQEHARRGILHGIGVMFPAACWTEATVQTLSDAATEVGLLVGEAIAARRVQALLACPVINDVLSVRS